MPCETAMLAKLIKKCAFELDTFDKLIIDKANEEGRPFSGHGVSGGPNSDGRRICEETARGMNAEPLGMVAYLLLAYAWNDALDWADKQT